MSRTKALLAAAALTGLAFGAANAMDSRSTAESSWTTFPVKEDASLKDPLVRKGQQVFQARCHLCHGDWPKDTRPGMVPMVGTQVLQAKYKGSRPALLDQRTDLTPELVKFYVRKGTAIMPFFRPTEVTDEELAALSAYLTRKRR